MSKLRSASTSIMSNKSCISSSITKIKIGVATSDPYEGPNVLNDYFVNTML